MPLIETTTGQIILPKTSGKCFVLHSSTLDSKPEVFLGKVATNSLDSRVRNHKSPVYYPSVPGTNKDLSGQYVKATYNVADGEILKVFIYYNRGYGKMPLTASVYLRVREGAAFRKLRFKLCDNATVAFQYAEVSGCVDIMEVEEAERRGVKILPALRSQASASMRAKVLTENIVISPETATKPLLETRTVQVGDQVKTIVREKRRRAIG